MSAAKGTSMRILSPLGSCVRENDKWIMIIIVHLYVHENHSAAGSGPTAGFSWREDNRRIERLFYGIRMTGREDEEEDEREIVQHLSSLHL